MEDPRQDVKNWLRAGDLEPVLRAAAALHGHYCPGLAFGVKAAYAALERLGFDNTGMEELAAVVECNNCFADGVQFASGCSFGNNALVFKDLGKTAVTLISRRAGAAVRVALRPGQWRGDDASDLEREAADAFRIVVKERRDDPDARARLDELWPKLSFAVLDKPLDRLFLIQDVDAEPPPYAPIFDSVACAQCGEEVMETRARVVAGRPVCMTCAGADCFAVLGRGVAALPQGALR